MFSFPSVKKATPHKSTSGSFFYQNSIFLPHYIEIRRKWHKMKPLKANDIGSISPERRRIAKIFKTNIDRAIEELGVGYEVTLQGAFDKTPILIQVEIFSKDEIP
jgi:NAD-dependent SIR2 family protein deacetylase